MGIEDIQISEELETNAPSIKYRGNEGPKSPQEMEKMIMASLEEEYAKYVFEMQEQGLEPMSMQKFIEQAMAEGQMSKGPILPSDEDPINPFQPKPQGPVLPDRQMAANGGIMDIETPKRGRVDGPGSYAGIGSWFQENIMDPLKNATIGEAASKAASEARVAREDAKYGKNYESPIDTFLKGKKGVDDAGNETRTGGQGANILPVLGGAIAGLFTKKGEDGTSNALTQDETALALADLKKTANVLDQKQAMAANLNFTPAVAARKYSPQDMVDVYQNAANGGRIGYNQGNIVNPFSELETFQLKGLGYDVAGKGVEPFGGVDVLKDILKVNQQRPYAMGGRIGFDNGGGIMMASSDMGDPKENAEYHSQRMFGKPYKSLNADELEEFQEEMRRLMNKFMSNGGRINKAEGGIMDLGGMEKDYRAEGGFVPIGKAEKADDVPARLSVNEFVFTADAVRNAGGGDIDQGAQVMENMMKHLEQGGQVSEESQGMQGARDMFATSERLSEVI